MVTRGTRKVGVWGPENAIDRYTAIQLYTAAGAHLNGVKNRRGTLQAGRLADLVAYHTDPVTCPVDKLLSLRPAFTVVGGRVVYDAEGMHNQPG